MRVRRRRTGEPLARGAIELGAVPGADEFAVLAFERAAEMQARVGRRPDPVAAPVDVQLAAEERHQDGSLDGNVGDLAKGMLHDGSPMSIDAIAFMYMHVH